MKCPKCNGKRKFIGYYVNDNPVECECVICNGTGEVQMTNEEYLRSCNTEQLAEVLNKIFMTRTFCHICPEGDVCDIGYKCKYSEGKKIEDWVEWLKQPHREVIDKWWERNEDKPC